MVKVLLSNKYSIVFLIFHALLGAISTVTNWPLIIWFYLFLGTSLYSALISGKSVWLLVVLAYVPGIEVIGRMTSSYPFIPWEIGKYIPVVFLFLLLLIEKVRFERLILGLAIIILTIPSWLLGNSDLERISFSLFGIINTGILCVVFYERSLYLSEFKWILKSMTFSIVIILFYVIVKSPGLADVNFGLASTAKMTGGFGANQVSTIFGVGLVITAISYLLGFNVFGRKWISLVLIGMFLFRGLLSFSRGGILVAVMAILAIIVVLNRYTPPRQSLLIIKKIKLSHLILGLVFLGVVFFVSNEITGGNLVLRYLGETNTSLNSGERSLNSITTGRFEIFMADIKMWLDNPFWGVGGGNSDLLRRNYGIYNLSHSEFSRLLAEQGVFGLLVILLLLYPLVYKLKFDRFNYALFIGFWILAIGSSFHAAMRTMLTPLFFALSLILVRPIDATKWNNSK